MIRSLLSWLGYEVVYVSEWGVKSHRYAGVDFHVGRPIHSEMGVAPPWAKRVIRRKRPSQGGKR